MAWHIEQGDCIEVMKTIPDHSIEAIITDLPYGRVQCKWDVIIPFAPMWAAVKRVLMKNGVFVTTSSQPFTSDLVLSNRKWFRYEWIWEKERPTNIFAMGFQPGNVHENVLVFYGNGGRKTTYNPIVTQAVQPENNTKHNGYMNAMETMGGVSARVSDSYDQTKRQPRSVIKVNRDRSKLHPTQKPVALYEYLVRTYTNEGDTVLDFCCGSGTTGVACINTSRNFTGIEKESEYVEIARKRCEEASMQGRLGV